MPSTTKFRDQVVVLTGASADGKVNFGFPQISTLKMEVVSYLPDECPLCRDDIELVKPGSRKIK